MGLYRVLGCNSQFNEHFEYTCAGNDESPGMFAPLKIARHLTKRMFREIITTARKFPVLYIFLRYQRAARVIRLPVDLAGARQKNAIERPPITLTHPGKTGGQTG